MRTRLALSLIDRSGSVASARRSARPRSDIYFKNEELQYRSHRR